MKKITPDFFEKVDIVELVSEVVSLKKVGNQYRGLCPFHNERTPSFYVSPIGVYHCFGCNESGNAIRFVMKLYGYDYEEAVDYLAKKFNITLQEYEDKNYEFYEILNYASDFYKENLKKNQNVINYLKSRGLNESSILKFKIGYADEKIDIINYLIDKGFGVDLLFRLGLAYKDAGGDMRPFFVNRIMFPIFSNDGKYVIAFSSRSIDGREPKYLNSQDSEIFKKSYTSYAFNFAKSSIVKKKFVIIVEGFFDVIVLHQKGYENTISPMGTAISEYQAQMIKKYVDKAYLFFDNDSAGQKACIRSIGILLKSGIIPYIVVGDEGKDPDELALEGGLDKLIENPYNINEYFKMLYGASKALEEQLEIVKLFRDSLANIKENNFGMILIEEIKPYFEELYNSLRLKVSLKAMESNFSDEVYVLWCIYKQKELRDVLDEIDEDVFYSQKAKEIYRAIKLNLINDGNYLNVISKIEFSNKTFSKNTIMEFIKKWKERKALRNRNLEEIMKLKRRY